MSDDREILRSLARHLRKHEVGCFDDESDDQERAELLIEWFAESVDTLNVPPVMPEPCQPIGCDAGIHLAGCTYAEIDEPT
jgi:hypothetical protein